MRVSTSRSDGLERLQQHPIAKMFLHSPGLCKWETNKVAWTEPYSIPANQKYCFSSTEGRPVFHWLLSSNINDLSPDSRILSETRIICLK